MCTCIHIAPLISISSPHPGRGVELGQQEEDVLLPRLQRFVLTAAVAVLCAQGERGGELLEAGCDVGLFAVRLAQLAPGATLRGDVPQQLEETGREW